MSVASEVHMIIFLEFFSQNGDGLKKNFFFRQKKSTLIVYNFFCC